MDAYAVSVEEVLEYASQLQHTHELVQTAHWNPLPQNQLNDVEWAQRDDVYPKGAGANVSTTDTLAVQHLIIGRVDKAERKMQQYVHAEQQVADPVDCTCWRPRHPGNGHELSTGTECDPPHDHGEVVEYAKQLYYVPQLEPAGVGVNCQSRHIRALGEEAAKEGLQQHFVSTMVYEPEGSPTSIGTPTFHTRADGVTEVTSRTPAT
eukprot:scaffold53962_cov56-Phaeocystis_antarctica.AAC.8